MLIEGTRRRHNWTLYKVVGKPLDEVRGTEFDPWTYVDGKHVFTTNPVWEAALVEYERRHVLYQTLVPLSKWGVE